MRSNHRIVIKDSERGVKTSGLVRASEWNLEPVGMRHCAIADFTLRKKISGVSRSLSHFKFHALTR